SNTITVVYHSTSTASNDTYTLSLHAALPISPSTFAHLEGLLPRAGVAMEVACGRGEASVWLALGGLEVWASDVSPVAIQAARRLDRKSTRLNSSHVKISYAVFCFKKKMKRWI